MTDISAGQPPCAADPDLFFGPDGESRAAQFTRTRQAKAICRSCHLIQWCLEDALAITPQHGIRGCKTATERRAILRERRLAAAGGA